MTLSTRQIASLLADAIHEASQPANAPAHNAPAPARARPHRQVGRQAEGTAHAARSPIGSRLPAGQIRRAIDPRPMGPGIADYHHAVLHSLVIGDQRPIGGLLGGGIEFDD